MTTIDITSISDTKIGDEPGCDASIVRFDIAPPAAEWVVRVNSTGPFDGSLVLGSGSGSAGFGQGAFGMMPFGLSETLEFDDGVVTITRDHVLHGANDVQVYARDITTGQWSFHHN